MTVTPNKPASTPLPGTAEARLEALITPIVEGLGYELVHVELLAHRSKTLRVFIDRLKKDANEGIGIDDCAAVSRALDEPLEAANDAALAGGYELEVSSPGIDRPLRKPKDFDAFSGREARIHVFRPLTAEEMGNPEYQTRNPKQKNFIGRLVGMNGTSVKLSVSASMGSEKKAKNVAKKNAKKAAGTEERRDDVLIPLELISKANLEPDFDILEEKRK